MIIQLLIFSFLAVLSINRVQGKVHVVNVGNGGFRYDPQVTNASRGDIVTFKFFPTNHSVYRAVYTESPQCPGGYCNPCIPSNIYFPAQNDFFFSTLFLGNVSNPPEWNLTINDTQPIFFSCNAPGSCNPNGMVGVINPNSSTSIQKQATAAKEAQYQLSPGDKFPSESAPAAPSSSSSSPASSAQPSSSPSSSPSGGSQNNGSGSGGGGGLSKGAIAGIVVGAVVAVALFGALIFYYAKSRAYSHIFSASQGKSGEDSGVSSSSAPGGGGGGLVGAWLASQQRQQQQQQREKLGMDTEAQAQAQHASYHDSSTRAGSPRASSPRPTAPGSPTPEQGAQFVGYNRTSGNEEYAFEAPGIDHQINEIHTPPLRPSSWSRDAKMSGGPGSRVELP